MNAGGFVGTLYISNDSTENLTSAVDINLEGTDYARVGGLFGSVETTKVAMVNADIGACSYSGIITASTLSWEYVGGLIGELGFANLGGDMSQCVLMDSHASGSLSASGGQEADVGGVIGEAIRGNISGCTAECDVLASGDSGMVGAGGLIGDCRVSADNCSALGDVSAVCTQASDISYHPSAGGLIGVLQYNGNATTCFASGAVSAQGGYTSFAGGFVGLQHNTNTLNNASKSVGSDVSSCYVTGAASASGALMQNNAGGFVGQMEVGAIGSCWASGSATCSGDPGWFNAAGGFAGSAYEGSAITDSYCAGPVAVQIGDASIGGFVGRLAGNLTNCYSMSKVTLAGTTNVQQDATGLVGTIRSTPVVRHCADMCDIGRGYPMFVDTANTDNPTFTQITNAQLSKQATYTGWDFTNTWMMPASGSAYRLPILRGVNEKAQSAMPMPAHLK